MSRLNLKNEGDEHNFWQNYTDLMSGFLVVFIITSLVAWYGYIKVTGAIGGDGGSIKIKNDSRVQRSTKVIGK